MTLHWSGDLVVFQFDRRLICFLLLFYIMIFLLVKKNPIIVFRISLLPFFIWKRIIRLTWSSLFGLLALSVISQLCTLFHQDNVFLFEIFFTGGVFKLELFLPEEYPMAAPKVFLLGDISTCSGLCWVHHWISCYVLWPLGHPFSFIYYINHIIQGNFFFLILCFKSADRCIVLSQQCSAIRVFCTVSVYLCTIRKMLSQSNCNGLAKIYTFILMFIMFYTI